LQPVQFDATVLYCYITSLVCEGVFYSIQTIATQLDEDTETIVMDVVSVGQIINGIFIWTVRRCSHRPRGPKGVCPSSFYSPSPSPL
jgi:hypothetical protein